ncbi:MAG: type II secretion system F family protein [bacterium]|nr:type II secretion system F family protein [bacterium]
MKQKFLKLLAFFQPISAESKMFFIQHLGVMVKSGLSITDALATLSEEAEGKHLKHVIHDVATSVSQGKTLADSFACYPSVFGELFVNMIRAGEASGKLEEALKELHCELAKDHTLRSKVRGALIYPTVIVVVMIGIGIFMMTVVLPRLIGIFDEINATLPIATRIVIALSKFVTAHGLIMALATLIVCGLAITFARQPKGKAMIHFLMLRFPIIGSIVRKINLARFSRTLSSLLKTDIPFATALTITGNVLGNVYYRKAVIGFSGAVKRGVTLESLLRKEPRLFPPLVRQMVSVGEKTGTLDTILGEIANFYEEEVTTTMETLPALIEPLLIVVLGLGVAGLAVAIIMPMYSLAQQF